MDYSIPSQGLSGNISRIDSVGECRSTDIFIEYLDMVMLCVYVPTSILNLLVIVFAWKLYHRTESSNHILIGAIGLADIIVTGVAGPMEMLARMKFITNSWGLSRIINSLDWLGLATSSFGLGLLNVEKIIYFRWPLHHPTLVTTNRVLILVTVVWLTCTGVILFIMFYPGIATINTESWSLSDISFMWYEIFIHVFCTLPIVSSAVLSLYLYRLTHKLLSLISSRPSIKSTIFTFVTTFWTVVSLLPFRLYTILRLHVLDEATLKNCFWSNTSWCLLFLLMLSPALNPVITLVIYVPYRRMVCYYVMNVTHCRMRTQYREVKITESYKRTPTKDNQQLDDFTQL